MYEVIVYSPLRSTCREHDQRYMCIKNTDAFNQRAEDEKKCGLEKKTDHQGNIDA